ncbi:hypothetical protein J4G43_049550 [Bradyrhizobium barranii subsp. barranii]|uniref:Uncharacterized protein n=1 Tax=Bradyrhizobium barranii subsp. barranii TaxID=2823807 RepID=A0A939MFA7_9BRAD|nr:hypothetical protein [Bradyrhizobium barranii]UEM12365.1 hypothetical protein J4G43_049550 [Bradyrhizobium barranii subsp. barranii]
MICVRVLSLLFLLMASAGAGACAQTDFVATSVKVDPVMQPKQPGDVFKECANNQACSAVLKGAASYLGVSPTLVSAVLAIVP